MTRSKSRVIIAYIIHSPLHSTDCDAQDRDDIAKARDRIADSTTSIKDYRTNPSLSSITNTSHLLTTLAKLDYGTDRQNMRIKDILR